jgi:hypothetical protein
VAKQRRGPGRRRSCQKKRVDADATFSR